MIPFGDLKRQHFLLEKEIENAVIKVLRKGWYILGNELENFEKEFAKYCGKDYGIGIGNGTDALFLALKALSIEGGDEVITVPNTAIPTVSAIVASGAKPVFVDCNKDYLIDVEKIEKAITKKTKAIIPVHLYGQACDMDKIIEIAGKYNLHIVEDCCQAHGAEYKGKKVPIGNIGCFSFYPSKNLGADGDAGMIVTDSKEFGERIKLLRNYGQSDRYHARFNGYNSRLDEIQAAILNVKLKYLDKWNEIRREIASKYNFFISNLVVTPEQQIFNKHIYHLYVVRTEKREELAEFLKKREIMTAIHYPIPIHLQEAYKFLGYKKGDFPNSEKFCSQILSLPIFPELKEEEIKKISEAVKEFFIKKPGSIFLSG